MMHAETGRPRQLTPKLAIMKTFLRPCGIGLLCGALLTLAVNAIIAPLMFHSRSLGIPPETTGLFLFRQSLSGLAALMLIFGSLGVHLMQRDRAGRFGAVSFVFAFIGSCLLFAVEFTDVFVFYPLAGINLAALSAIDKHPLTSIGFASAAGVFALGWLLLAISVWRTGILPRWAAIAAAAGLVLIPLLQASPLHAWGAIIANGIFSVGLAGLGVAVAKRGPSALENPEK
ncbi:MAG: hypothetical protein QOH88_427 [Verrucomicrobiota bacterium]